MGKYYEIRMKKKFRLLRLVVAFIIGAFCVKYSFMPEFQTVNFVFFLLIMLFSSVLFFAIDSIMDKLLDYLPSKNTNKKEGEELEKSKNKYLLYSKIFHIPSIPKRILCIFLDFVFEMFVMVPCFTVILGIMNILGYYLYMGEMLPWDLIFQYSAGNMMFRFIGCLIVFNECFDKVSDLAIGFSSFLLKGFLKNNSH